MRYLRSPARHTWSRSAQAFHIWSRLEVHSWEQSGSEAAFRGRLYGVWIFNKVLKGVLEELALIADESAAESTRGGSVVRGRCRPWMSWVTCLSPNWDSLAVNEDAPRFLLYVARRRIARGKRAAMSTDQKIRSHLLTAWLEAWHHAWTTGDDTTAQRDRAGHRSHEDGWPTRPELAQRCTR